MFHKLKRRLILLYGISTSVILTVAMTGLFLWNNSQSQEQKKFLFQKNMEQITEKIRMENVISTTWLAKIQQENHIFLFLEYNGKELARYVEVDSSLDAEKIIVKIKHLAEEEGICLNRKPIQQIVQKTSVYPLNQGRGKTYLGMASFIPKGNDWVNISAICYDTGAALSQWKQLLVYAFINLMGVLSLFMISSFYIGKVIRPLEEGQQKQNAFIAAASHELRSPLAVIKAGITSIREDAAKAGQFLPHIEGECDRMTRLIGDLLMLAYSDTGTWSLEKEPVDMDTLLIESYDMFCTCYNNKNYQLTLDLTEEKLYQVSGDAQRIQQILAIFVDNAMRHTCQGGKIALRAYNQRHYVVLEVEDHGAGISREEKAHVFERFYMGDASRKDKKHFGLGLSIAKELTGLHQGEITIKDTPGGGATFILRLPAGTS